MVSWEASPVYLAVNVSAAFRLAQAERKRGVDQIGGHPNTWGCNYRQGVHDAAIPRHTRRSFEHARALALANDTIAGGGAMILARMEGTNACRRWIKTQPPIRERLHLSHRQATLAL